MKRCKAQLISTKEKCSRTAVDENYCKQHRAKYQLDTSYFTVLPIEIMELCILYLDYITILNTFQKLSTLSSFKRIRKSNGLWKKIWHRDVSSFTALSHYSYKKYYNVYNKMKQIRFWELTNNSSKLVGRFNDRESYLATNGYDILFQSLFRESTISKHELHNLMCISIRIGHSNMVKLFLDMGVLPNFHAIIDAIQGNDVNILRMLFEKLDHNLVSSYVEGLMCYSRFRVDTVKVFIENGYRNYNKLLDNAIFYGNMDLIKFVLEIGTNNYNEVLQLVKSRHIKNKKCIIELIKSYMDS